MLNHLLQQLIGLMVLGSCSVTLFLYLRFKRHQKASSGGRAPNLASYGSFSLFIVVLFVLYSKSFTQHIYLINFEESSPTNYFDNSKQTIIDSRPINFRSPFLRLYKENDKWNIV